MRLLGRSPTPRDPPVQTFDPVVDSAGHREDATIDVVLQYFNGCPNWIDARSIINQALEAVDEDAEVVEQRIETFDDAVAVGFTGSPTILIDHTDPFTTDGAVAGLSCRLYPTPDGLRGTPTLSQLIAALTAAKQQR